MAFHNYALRSVRLYAPTDYVYYILHVCIRQPVRVSYNVADLHQPFTDLFANAT